MEGYQSGHNGTDSKSDGPGNRHAGSNPTPSANQKENDLVSFSFWFMMERRGFEPKVPIFLKRRALG